MNQAKRAGDFRVFNGERQEWDFDTAFRGANVIKLFYDRNLRKDQISSETNLGWLRPYPQAPGYIERLAWDKHSNCLFLKYGLNIVL